MRLKPVEAPNTFNLSMTVIVNPNRGITMVMVMPLLGLTLYGDASVGVYYYMVMPLLGYTITW